jgi:Kef-type K+ transport system membrane component KefB
MGRIPNFTTTIFPTPSLVPFSLVANIGLVFFMFIVGMEVDFGVVKRNVKASVSISVAGLVIPLGMGAALGAPLYHEFVKPTVNYGYFLLFVAVAVGITVRATATGI